MGSNLAKLKQWQNYSLIIVFLMAVLLRMIPPIKYGLPYGFDIYEFISRVFVLNEEGFVPLPHGPLFYYIQLVILKAVGYTLFIKILTFLEPIIFSFFILPLYFVSKQFKTLENRPVYTLLYAATVNLLVHQVGGVIIPEGLGILFYGMTIFFAMKAMMGDWRWMFPAMFSGFLTAMSHHLSVFQLILFFASLFLSYFYYYLRHEKTNRLLHLLILIFANILLLLASSISVWSLMGEEENMLKLLLIMVFGNRFLPFLLVAGAVIFPIITMEVAKFVKRYEKFTFKKTFISILVVGLVVPSILAIVFRPDSLPTILWFTVPISLGFLPFAIHGFIQYCKNVSLYETVFFLAPLMIFMVESSLLLSLEGYRTLIYRIPTFVIFFATPLAGYGLSCYSSELNSVEKEYLAGMILSYFILSLASTSYPKPEFAYGVNESVNWSEIALAEDAYRYSLAFDAGIDTDNRLGVILMFLSHREACWMGNITSWFLPSNSWLVNVSLSGKPYYPKEDMLILVSDSMREIFGGKVLNLVTKSSGSLSEDVMDYLNNSPGVDRLGDAHNGAIYLFSWKKLNQSNTRPP
ncbi:MAG: hypothetical protein QW304_08385 [Thermoproteota archaeon]